MKYLDIVKRKIQYLSDLKIKQNNAAIINGYVTYYMTIHYKI